jgi:hypothetical protein
MQAEEKADDPFPARSGCFAPILVVPAISARPPNRTYYIMRREADVGGKARDLTRSDMRQDVDQSSEWIPHVEPPDAPRLSRRTVLDLESRSHRSLVEPPAPPSAAMLIWGVDCVSVAKVMIHPRSMKTLIPRILP